MIIEDQAQATPADDPFTSNSLESCQAVIQLAVSACSHARPRLPAPFVLDFYGDIVCIDCFDHACAVVP